MSLSPRAVHIEIQTGQGHVMFDNVWAGRYGTFARAYNESHDIYACGLNSDHQLGEYSLGYDPLFAGGWGG